MIRTLHALGSMLFPIHATLILSGNNIRTLSEGLSLRSDSHERKTYVRTVHSEFCARALPCTLPWTVRTTEARDLIAPPCLRAKTMCALSVAGVNCIYSTNI